jgi:hypothetical protein
MGKENGEGTIEWFVIKLGFCNEGIDIRKGLDDTHATLVECEVVWEKRKNHNGFKFEICTNLEITIKVLELYPLIYQKQKITNNNIALCFAKALLIDKKKIKENWAHFAKQMGGMGTRVHKVKPLHSEGKKKVLSNVVIIGDGSKEGMLPLEDHVMVELAIVEEELSPKQQHLTHLETLTVLEIPDLPQRKWYVQEILDAQVKVVSSTQSEPNFLKANRDILQNNIKA